MTVLVVGAGSAGQRHAQLIAAAGLTVAITDPRPLSGELDGVRSLPFRDGLLGEFPAIVLASPNSVHEEQAIDALRAGAKVMVEKPMATTGAGADRIVAVDDGRTMVAYNLRLHPPVERLVEIVRSGAIGRPMTARLWFGSYLPAWRPAVDYRATYSSRRDLGGGVLLDAIHELDLAIWLFGDVRVAGALVTRVSELEIDVEDVATVVGQSADGVAISLSLDYLSRDYRRGIEVVGTDATVRLDWATRAITIASADTSVTEDAGTSVSTSYERQARRFVAWIGDGEAPPVDAPEGARSVHLVEAIRAAG